MQTLLFRSPSDPGEPWREALESEVDDLRVRIWPEPGPAEEVDYALVWGSPGQMLHSLPNLRVVFSVGAGVEHLIGPQVPAGVPVVRMVEPGMTERLVGYVVYHVLRHARGMPGYERQQREAQWRVRRNGAGSRVGVMGLGEIGSACARTLDALGFDVAGFVRTPRKESGSVRVFAGAGRFDEFLARTDILVCVLPLTEATRDILDGSVFARLAEDAVVINVARGEHVVEEDLLAALEEGRVAHAVLDVFRTEPLPADHPFWSHPRVTVTPHVAALTDPTRGARRVGEAIRAAREGRPLPNVVDRARGY